MKKNRTMDDIIKELWLSTQNIDIAKILGVSESCVRRRADKLGLVKKSLLNSDKQEKVQIQTNIIQLDEQILALLLNTKKTHTIESLSDRFDVGISKIKEAIEMLKEKNVNLSNIDNSISLSDKIETSKPTIIPQNAMIGKRVKIGFVTDNHLGSRYERLDVLNAMYDIFQKRGIDTVYNAGNVIDGEARFNKFDIHTYGMDNQCQYFAEKYPQRDGIKTYFITGDDHEGWYVQREGINIGNHMQDIAKKNNRDDLIYLGHMEHDIILKAPKGQAVLRIIHPGGGSSYAYSYTSQKIVESYSPGEKPDIVLGGHYHKASYNYIRGVHFVQGGCTMDQSPFMRKKRLEAHVGGWVIEYEQSANGVIISFSCEFFPFYGKEFYTGDSWKYHY